MSTHGASIIGNVSDEIDPSVVSTRGLSTNTVAATIRDAGDPARSARPAARSRRTRLSAAPPTTDAG